MAKKQEHGIEKAPETSLAMNVMYEEVAGTGFEKATSDDFIIPFLKLLQKTSPEVDADNSAYIPGARAGMFYDTSTGELMDVVNFIPCYYHRTIVEWRNRESGGGFVSNHEPGYEQQFGRDDSGRWVTPTGTYLADTRYFFGLRLKPTGETVPTVLSFTSTQIKKSRTWMTRMQSMKFTRRDGSMAMYPIYSHVWKVSSVPEENEKGSWRGYKIELGELIQNPSLFADAKKSHEVFEKNSSRTRPPVEHTQVSGDVPF